MLFDEDTQTVTPCWSSDLPGSDTDPDEDSGDSGDESQSDPGGDSDVQPDPARH